MVIDPGSRLKANLTVVICAMFIISAWRGPDRASAQFSSQPAPAQPAPALPAPAVPASAVSAPLTADQRTDSLQTKLRLFDVAVKQGDFDLARSLTHSLHDSLVQTQLETAALPESLIPIDQWQAVSSLPESLQSWAKGWRYVKAIRIEETGQHARVSEPVEISLSFPSDQVRSLPREFRMARLVDGRLIELPCQVLRHFHRPAQKLRHAQVLFMIDSQPEQQQTLFCFYGNDDAELPDYPSDLITEGEGYALDISNAHFKAALSRQTGQLERLTMRREHGLELYAGGEGHGEPPGIDWAHDYVDQGNFQKLRISLWDKCPDYEVIRGPLCTIVRRWGFPYSPVHPIYSPARLKVDIEYRFYAGLPWFHKLGTMTAVQEFQAAALRDDEWVFSGQPFTDKLWMDVAGHLHQGDVPPEAAENLWGIGFTNRDTKDAFMALFLEHSAIGLPEPKHNGSPNLYYRWHGSVWSRYPLPVKTIPAGAVLKQRNAYATLPLVDMSTNREIESLRASLASPPRLVSLDARELAKLAASITAPSLPRLARAGEAGDSPIDKRQIWRALEDCKDGQLYMADINVVELGMVYDVRVRGNVVTLVMTMPHRGRGRLGYFIDGSISVHPTLSVPVRERIMQVPGVKQVAFEQVWAPTWSSNELTEAGRKKLGL